MDSPGTFKVTLFQVSDIHWSESSLDGKSFEEIARKSNYSRFIESLCDEKRLRDRDGTFNVLILNGDNVANSNYKRFFPSFRRHILTPLLALKKPGHGDRSFFNAIVAVPGNHDILREQLDKFAAFKYEFDRIAAELPADITLVTPFTVSPFYTIDTPFHTRDGVAKTLRIWAVNSSEICGYLEQNDQWVKTLSNDLLSFLTAKPDPSAEEKERIAEVERILEKKIKVHDPGFVSEADIRRCRNALADEANDLFRIAIVHHNSLPLMNDDNLKYKFWNANEFNSHLIDHQVRLLLHGHQHIGDVCLFSSSRVSNGRTRSYLADGFLTVGSPAFDCLSNRTTDTGYNIIQLSFSTVHKICEVRVSQSLMERDKPVFKEQFASYDLALEQIPDDDNDRKLLLPALNRILYSKQRLDGLVRAVDDPRFGILHSSTLRGFLSHFSDIRGVYALSVFPPGLWINSKISDVFLPLAGDIYAAAAVRCAERLGLPCEGKNSGRLFRFSSPIFHAIKRAKYNAGHFPIVEIAATFKMELEKRRQALESSPGKQKSQEEIFVKRRLASQADETFSMSAWGTALIADPGMQLAHGSWYVEEIAGRPHVNFDARQVMERRMNDSLAEMPRIVLWTRDQFRNPSALDVIEFHENLGIPLFWIDPLTIKNAKGDIRRKVGYVSVLALKHEGSGHDVNRVEAICHLGTEDHLTERLDPSLFWETAWPVAEFASATMYEREANVEYRLDTGRDPLNEFLWLLMRRQIMFAADVWILANSDATDWTRFNIALATCSEEDEFTEVINADLAQ